MIKKIVLLGTLITLTRLNGYSYTFTNETPYRLTLNICAATCNCQNRTVESHESTTFETGGCCLDYLRILSAEIDEVPQVRPGSSDEDGLSLPSTGLGLLCKNYQGVIVLKNGNFLLREKYV